MKSMEMATAAQVAERGQKAQSSEPATLEELNAELRHFWHPVAVSRDVRDKPVAVRLLDVQLVLYRPARARVACLEDVCLHRGTKLSLGWVREDGGLVCGYHGWTYDEDGVCVAVPSLPPGRSIPRRAKAISYRVQERYGLVWVLLEGPAREDIVAVPEWSAEGWRPTLCGPWPVESHATRVVENFLDVAHPQWVHPGLLDDRDDGVVDPYSCEFVDGVLTSTYADMTFLTRPRSFLVIGRLDELIGDGGGPNLSKVRSFELFRRSLAEPEIVTFDELLARAEWTVDIEGDV